jgi:hypothetical protein
VKPARAAAAALIVWGFATGRPAVAQSGSASADSAIARALTLASANDSAGGRRILDSLLKVRPAAPMLRAEATYWLSRFAPSVADRERMLSALIVDYSFSPRVPKALYELGMLELSHSEREKAALHLARFLTTSPEDSNRVSASLTLGKLLLERGEPGRACAILLAGRAAIPDSAVEIRNQYDFTASRCQGVDTTTPPPARAAPADSAASPVRRSGAFTVQVAAYDQRDPADRLATTLRGHGLEARVIGTVKPFRVRVGRYATRAEAEAASRRIDTLAKTRTIVVVIGPEEP